jgi:hypothetical protein
MKSRKLDSTRNMTALGSIAEGREFSKSLAKSPSGPRRLPTQNPSFGGRTVSGSFITQTRH